MEFSEFVFHAMNSLDEFDKSGYLIFKTFKKARLLVIDK